jgi:hypothetical protein
MGRRKRRSKPTVPAPAPRKGRFLKGARYEQVRQSAEPEGPIHISFTYLSNLQDFRCPEDGNDCSCLGRKIVQITQLTWREAFGAPRHKNGCEKLPRVEIKKQPHPRAPKDQFYYVFRLGGGGINRTIVGTRKGDIFYPLWIDPQGALYDHGGS